MFKIESYVTPILLSYVDKYVRDFKPADAQVSLWGGGVALHNLVLKADVLHQEVKLPFTLVSGRIHELLIQVPWTKIMSEPIVVTIDTIECVLSLTQPTGGNDEPAPSQPSPSRNTQVVEAPPGYMQALVRRIVTNIALRVHHLIVKYVQDDIVLSLNVKHLAVDSAGINWEPSFADIDPALPVIRRLVRLDDLTLCLDQADSDGKIRFYQEPLLYRCQLHLRVLTRLVSANTRRATSLSVQLRSSKLAWGATTDQLTLLLRLFRERAVLVVRPPTPTPKAPSAQAAPLNVSSSNSAEPARSESWSQWAWSWLPTWSDRDGVEEAPVSPMPVPVHFDAYFDAVSLVFKVMELDSGNRKRARGFLELDASHTAFKSSICNPTAVSMRLGARTFALLSRGRCLCGHMDNNADVPTYYMCKKETEKNKTGEEEWAWPEDQLSVVETAQAADEHYRATPDLDLNLIQQQEPSAAKPPDIGQPELPPQESTQNGEDSSRTDAFWQQMAPLFYVEYIHERSPPQVNINPYDNPPTDFQYSDWVEECIVKVKLEPVSVRVCMGLLHRLAVLRDVWRQLPPVPDPEVVMRTLTVEECEALNENLPQRLINIEVLGLHVRVHPWDHVPDSRSALPPLLLDLHLPKNSIVINGPLYPHRVCSAACQMPEASGNLWQAARLHITLDIDSIQAKISSFCDTKSRPCARADIKAIAHVLLNKEYFAKREGVVLGYSIKLREVNVCGSAARVQAACQIPLSLVAQRASAALRHTVLATDALDDEESVAIDLTLEELVARSFVTTNTITHIVTIMSLKATALHELKESELKQAWLFSAPDTPSTTPYLRLAVQWCKQVLPTSMEYAGVWTESMAVAVDPLFIAWLAYTPAMKPQLQSMTSVGSLRSTSSQYFTRRRTTPPSSSGRGGTKSGSGAEVHARTRSYGSSAGAVSKDAKRSEPKKTMLSTFWESENLLTLHKRLQRMIVNVEIGLTMLYVTMTTASAVNCETLRDAMESHASQSEDVLALSLGRVTMYSSTLTKQFWNVIKHDGPTFATPNKSIQDSFPWKMRLADVSCYTLEVKAVTDKSGRAKSASGLRSQLKTFAVATPRTVLELVTTAVTLSVVTKSLQIKQMQKPEVKVKGKEPTVEEKRLKYFTAGIDFRPATLKEFVRGPAKRKKTDRSPEPEKKPEPRKEAESKLTSGPVVSLGIHLHADTPPLIVRIDYDQVHVIAAGVHCLTHILALLQRPSILGSKSYGSYTSLAGSKRSLVRSVSELEETHSHSDDSQSGSRSELIPIFEAQSAQDVPHLNLKTFFWFQWVVSHVTVVAATYRVKLAFDMDDIISSVDMQSHYNQLKVKVASASVRHYARTGSDEWTAGVLGGRVLEAREPTNDKDDNHFLAITVTQAQISNLPSSWKEELHPKLLEQKTGDDSMWEIYATLAPLEAVLQPKIVEQLKSLVVEMAPRSFCPLQKEKKHVPRNWQWPFLYVTAGGLRLLLTFEEEKENVDDTFMFMIGKIVVNPHPENPICRRAIPGEETSWLTNAGGHEGRQYEIIVKNVAIRTAQFSQLIIQETSEAKSKGTASENPALKWTQTVVVPNITPVLHSVDVSCVLAPPLYLNSVLTCGPAIDLNLVSDCTIELSVDQLVMAQTLLQNMSDAIKSSNGSDIVLDEGVCPYAALLMSQDTEEYAVPSSTSLGFDTKFVKRLSDSGNNVSDTLKSPSELGADSGVDSGTTSTAKHHNRSDDRLPTKKSMSVGFVEHMSDSSEYLELFVTMGVIEVSLYTADDGSPTIMELRPPRKWDLDPPPEQPLKVVITEQRRKSRVTEDDNDDDDDDDDNDSERNVGSTKSLTEKTRNDDVGKVKLEITNIYPEARKLEGNLPLLHVSMHQPNLYYWRKKHQKNVQVSLFDLWVGLGAGQVQSLWHAVIFSTAKGSADPVTDIPPALATMKVVMPSSALAAGGSPTRGSIRLDVERPVMIEVSADLLMRLKRIYQLVRNRMHPQPDIEDLDDTDDTSPLPPKLPPLYRLKRVLVHQNMESITLVTTQVGVSGSQGAAGWDSVSLQLAAGGRPGRLTARVLVTAAVITAGPSSDARHVVLQPVMMGGSMEANWEAWRRAEGGAAAREPSVRLCLELDYVTLDLRPSDLESITRMRHAIQEVFPQRQRKPKRVPSGVIETEESDISKPSKSSTVAFERRLSVASADISDEHFYKDDLRSGAFKIVSGGQLPMAYQVTLHNNSVAWRYPHPRAITRLVVFPLPGQDEETECVLEVYSPVLGRWESHTRFAVPVREPREIVLYVPSPDAVFAVMWRFRVFENEVRLPPFEFNVSKFMPRADPLVFDSPPEQPVPCPACGVTAEQLSGVVRVDSCFSPRLAPRVRLLARVAQLDLHLHNAIPKLPSQSTPTLEGYYVSKPLCRTHRVVTLRARDGTLHALLASPAGTLALFSTNLSSDILESATGTMAQIVCEFRVQGGVSRPSGSESRARVALSRVRVVLHVPRLRTLYSLAMDWRTALLQYINQRLSEEDQNVTPYTKLRESEAAEVAGEALEGLVSLWLHNSCAAALRVGQEGTDEVMPLGPGASLAYRWRNPTAPEKLRFALVGPTADWHWSNSIAFTSDQHRCIKLHDAESTAGKGSPSSEMFLYTRAEELGARRCLNLAGRLCLANMLRSPLLYKVRSRCGETGQWRGVSAGELAAEAVGRSVLCSADEMALKVKFSDKETGWSGDIPLKECPKENVPWLVKVPNEGEMPFTSVWCRVVRARSDGRILATIWPLYVLYSQLPLDTDVLIVTEANPSSPLALEAPAPLVQAAAGRGTCTHLHAPGTTSARHNLSFQYRNIECPVTKEAVPLHYGVTDTSVFDKRAPVNTLDHVLADTLAWLDRSARYAKSQWPYSIVTKHWPGEWLPAMLQPRCDVNVRYSPVRVGGGCSLEVQLCPVVLLCNAAPIALTLRAHDAAPLCKLEPGTAISPPSSVIKKPFFISVELGRETFVSGELSVSGDELGRYGAPAPGRLALDRATDIAVLCNHKVALLTLHYEIKQEINILGMTSTYMLINRLGTNILISAMAVPSDTDDDTVLRPSTFKLVEPTDDDSAYGRALCKFNVVGHVWRGGDPARLRLYLCVALPTAAVAPVPVRLSRPPLRRAIALTDANQVSVAVVVTQVRHDGRWVVTVGKDPCPQLLIYNRTNTALVVAQPIMHADEPTTSKIMVSDECEGTRWHCALPPDGAVHYSTPSHCMRYPPLPNTVHHTPAVTFLTFAHFREEGALDWCSGVACADGEQLVQLAGAGATVKMRVRTHPHSTHIELRDVDHRDISARDIRQRLFETSSSEDAAALTDLNRLTRVGADDKRTAIRERKLTGSKETIVSLGPKHVVAIASGSLKAERETLSRQGTSVRTLPESQTDTRSEKSHTDTSTHVLFDSNPRGSDDVDNISRTAMRMASVDSCEDASVFHEVRDNEWEENASWTACDRLRVLAAEVAIELAAAADAHALLALHLDRAAFLLKSDSRRTKTTLAIADVQVDNLQYESGQYDFAVVATTRSAPLPTAEWPPLWNVFAERTAFAARQRDARLLLRLTHDCWKLQNHNYTELSEVELRVGPTALYVEDAYVTALAALQGAAASAVTSRAAPATDVSAVADAALLAEERALRNPLRLRVLLIHPLDLTLTLHTAVRMYIALDQSPLRLSAFKLHDTMTSAERLAHALTVHYLSAAILGAGWVVGGLELLGAPGAVAARVTGARGGVRGVAGAVAAALLRSLSAWAGSLARNLDLLAGDEEHARRAAAARRHPPANLIAGLAAGITNFAINILGAVGGLAHHPLVGVAVGESESGTAALRRGLVGALAKPLSATADLVAYAGHGLLTQTGWDPVPQPRERWRSGDAEWGGGWRRDCVRWAFRLADMPALAGFHVLLDGVPLHLIFTHKFLVMADPDTERIVEMIDFKVCSIGTYQGKIIELVIKTATPRRQPKVENTDEDDEINISAAAMARVARYTGADSGGAGGVGSSGAAVGGAGSELRVVVLVPSPGFSLALHAALVAAAHHNSDAHFPLL